MAKEKLTPEEQARVDEAAQQAAAEKQKAEAAREEKRRADKAVAENPHLHDPDYSGPLTGEQAQARLAKFDRLGNKDTKPATVAETK